MKGRSRGGMYVHRLWSRKKRGAASSGLLAMLPIAGSSGSGTVSRQECEEEEW